MATKIYEDGHVNLVDGTEVYLKPLKIKYLRRFMAAFDLMKAASDDEQAINVLSYCTAFSHVMANYEIFAKKNILAEIF